MRSAYATSLGEEASEKAIYHNVDQNGSVVLESLSNNSTQDVYAMVDKRQISDPVKPDPVDVEGEYAEYGPAPGVPDKKY